MDARIAVTEEDGRLYDTHNLKFLEIEDRDFIAAVINHDGLVLTLKSNGQIHRIEIDGEGNVRDYFVLSENDIISVGLRFQDGYSDIIAIRESENRRELLDFHYNDFSNSQYDDNLGKNVYLYNGAFISENQVIVLGWDIQIADRTLNSELIGVGVVHSYPSYIIIIEDLDGELILRTIGVRENSQWMEHQNHYLTYIHNISPWVEVVIIDHCAYLLNTDGSIAKLESNCAFTSSKIPPHILSNNIRMKNSRTR